MDLRGQRRDRRNGKIRRSHSLWEIVRRAPVLVEKTPTKVSKEDDEKYQDQNDKNLQPRGDLWAADRDIGLSGQIPYNIDINRRSRLSPNNNLHPLTVTQDPIEGMPSHLYWHRR